MVSKTLMRLCDTHKWIHLIVHLLSVGVTQTHAIELCGTQKQIYLIMNHVFTFNCCDSSTHAINSLPHTLSPPLNSTHFRFYSLSLWEPSIGATSNWALALWRAWGSSFSPSFITKGSVVMYRSRSSELTSHRTSIGLTEDVTLLSLRTLSSVNLIFTARMSSIHTGNRAQGSAGFRNFQYLLETHTNLQVTQLWVSIEKFNTMSCCNRRFVCLYLGSCEIRSLICMWRRCGSV